MAKFPELARSDHQLVTTSGSHPTTPVQKSPVLLVTQRAWARSFPGALEMSNVDLAAEFTEMIRAQRGFQANSRVITTSDEILQQLVNLKR